MERDFSRSRAILIGNGTYRTDSNISNILAAPACVGAMSELLTDELCGWPEDRIMPLVDVKTPQELARQVRKAASDVQDTLLLYYVGHGIRTTRGQLALTVGDSDGDPALVQISGILYGNIAEILRCGATTKLVILDCCKAELGNTENYAFQSADFAEEYPVEGLYFIGASKRHESARFAPDGRLTYFTENFIEVVQRGIPGPHPELRLDQIFPELRRRLVSAGLPEPVESGSRGAHQYAFARNAAYRPSADQSPARRILQQPLARRISQQRTDREAEDAAWALFDKAEKARALAKIAQEVADSDPERAKRLLTGAEQTARSKWWWKAEVLAEVAQAAANSDPQRAERIAQSITSKYWKAVALAKIAREVADSDPERAKRLCSDAEGTARSYQGSRITTARALAVVAESAARSDPQQAERIAQSIRAGDDPVAKARALMATARAVAASDPLRGERIAQSITDDVCKDGVSKARALAYVAQRAADSDPLQAERIAQSITEIARDDRGAKAQALAAVVRAMALSDPQRAREIARQAELIADDIVGKALSREARGHGYDEKALALAEIAQAVTVIDLRDGERLFNNAKESAYSIEYWTNEVNYPNQVDQRYTQRRVDFVLRQIRCAAEDSGLSWDPDL